jgi:hypothetical protein
MDEWVGEGGTNGKKLITVRKNTKIKRSLEENQEKQKDGHEDV